MHLSYRFSMYCLEVLEYTYYAHSKRDMVKLIDMCLNHYFTTNEVYIKGNTMSRIDIDYFIDNSTVPTFIV